VRGIEDIAMEAGAMAVEDEFDVVHGWADAACRRLCELRRPNAIPAIHAIEQLVAARATPTRTPPHIRAASTVRHRPR